MILPGDMVDEGMIIYTRKSNTYKLTGSFDTIKDIPWCKDMESF